jgi:hypothetical protein
VTIAVGGIAALSAAVATFVYWSGGGRQPGAASPARNIASDVVLVSERVWAAVAARTRAV